MGITLKKIAGMNTTPAPAGQPVAAPTPDQQAQPTPVAAQAQAQPQPANDAQPTPTVAAPAIKPAASMATTAAAAAPAVKPPPSWMMKGKELKDAHIAEQAKADLQKETQGAMYRFRMPINQEREVIFLDGNLDGDGMIESMGFYEHNMQLAGKYQQFTCLNGVPGMGPCPICEAGNKPALVNLLTVLNLTPYTIKHGPKAGTVIPYSRQLFVMKKTTLGKLQFKASKIGGLLGKKFTITRLDTGDGKSPAVGTEFEWNPIQLDDGSSINQLTKEQLVAMFGDDGKPADYEKEIPLLSADKLIALGAGKAPTGPGYEPKVAGGGNGIDMSKLASQL